MFQHQIVNHETGTAYTFTLDVLTRATNARAASKIANHLIAVQKGETTLDLASVKYVGPKTLAALMDFITTQGISTNTDSVVDSIIDAICNPTTKEEPMTTKYEYGTTNRVLNETEIKNLLKDMGINSVPKVRTLARAGITAEEVRVRRMANTHDTHQAIYQVWCSKTYSRVLGWMRTVAQQDIRMGHERLKIGTPRVVEIRVFKDTSN